jgi:hypothetical protein
LKDRGVEVSEPFYDVGGIFHHLNEEGVVTGFQRSAEAMPRTPPSKIPMTTNGFSKK